MVAVGQIWEYRRGPDRSWKVPDKLLYEKRAVFHTKMAWQIVSGTIRGDNFWWLAKVVRDEDGFLNIDTHEFSQEVFDSQERFRLIYDPAQANGVYCTQCSKLYPYANWMPSFECWACRNGF